MPIQRPATPPGASHSHTPRPVQPVDTVTDRNAPQPAKQGMTPQQRQMIAIGGLFVCLLIGGAIVYLLLFGSTPKPRSIAVDPSQQTPAFRQPQARAIPRPRQAIVKEDDTRWRVTASNSFMIVSGKSSGGYNVSAHYDSRQFLTPEQVAFISGAVRVKNDAAMATEWGVSPEQVEKLKAVKVGGPTVSLSSAERDELLKLWQTWNGAADGNAKTDAEKALIKRLDELSKAKMDESKKVFTAKLDEAKKIFTPQQVEKISQR